MIDLCLFCCLFIIFRVLGMVIVVSKIDRVFVFWVTVFVLFGGDRK